MEKKINFSGLGFEIGQNKSGLIGSSSYARRYFSILKNAGISLVDCRDVTQPETSRNIKVYSGIDLAKISWTEYREAYNKLTLLLTENIPLINWGGDHSVAISTVAAFCRSYQNGYVIWIDAHADLNLPDRSLSGNLHGMPLSVLLNLENISTEYFTWIKHFLDPKKIIYIGLRDLDVYEAGVIADLGIRKYSYADIQSIGIEQVSNEIVELVKNDPVHISFDIDSVNPLYAPSTGVPVEKGLTPYELEALGQVFFKNLNIKCVDVVEINPRIGNQLEVDQTYITAFNFLKSIFTYNNQGELHESLGKRNETNCFDEMEWSL